MRAKPKYTKIKTPRVLFIDIEVFPLLIWAWGIYEVNALKLERPTILCCFSAKWLGGKQITKALPDYTGYRRGHENDKKLVKDIWKLLDEADIVIGQNLNAFDIKMINAEFVKHGMPPPSPYKTVDTLKTARKVFRFPSNKLDDLGDQLHEGRKVETGGKDLWFRCLANDPKAWKLMKRYNAFDVILLEKIYKRFLPWIPSHPMKGMTENKYGKCGRCGSKKLVSRGTEIAGNKEYRRLHCRNCGGWQQIPL